MIIDKRTYVRLETLGISRIEDRNWSGLVVDTVCSTGGEKFPRRRGRSALS